METKRLGGTGLVVSRIGLGLAALGRPGYINIGHADDLEGGRDVAAMESHAFEVLDAARAGGVRYLDAARSYGRAEAFLANWLAAREIGPDSVVVGSKWGYTYTAGWEVEADRHEVKDHSLANLDRQVAETRALLGDQVDLYQIHSATLETGVLADDAVLDRLARLKASGWRIGLSITGPSQGETLRRALDIEVEGVRLFDCVQSTWNLLERSAGPALEAAHRAGLGVIVKEALANGRLTGRNDDPGFIPARLALEAEASRLGVEPDALALAAVLARPWADVVLSGAATVAQLRSNLQASEFSFDDRAEAALVVLTEGPREYWATRSRLRWN